MDLRVERLEERRLMSAQLSFSAGQLRVVANELADEILICSTGTVGGVRVLVDQDGLPGLDFGQNFTGVVGITVVTRGGDDELTIRGISITGGINLDLGEGADQLQLQSVSVSSGIGVNLGTGDDDFTLTGGALVGGAVRILGQAGQDNVNVTNGVRLRGILTVDGGDHDDQVAIENGVRFDGHVTLSLGNGGNEVRIAQAGTVGQVLFAQSLYVTGGSGIDEVDVTGGVKVTSGLIVSLGDGADQLKLGDPVAGGTLSLGGLQVDLGAGTDVMTIARTTILGFGSADGGAGLDSGRDLGGNTFLRRFTGLNFELV